MPKSLVLTPITAPSLLYKISVAANPGYISQPNSIAFVAKNWQSSPKLII